jgi:Ca2+-dependent lipid-binding protein|tara:strand:- start:4189 stop:4584 length:396 start_codon:yes stop_codon:yes gene_type:complete
MSILGKIFSSGTGELIKNVGDVVDNLTTTDEERLEAKQKLKDMIMGYEAQMQKEVSERWKFDMQSDSWLSKNIRPMVLIFLVVSTIILIFIDGGVISFIVEPSWINLLQITLLTVIGAYFGGRSYEKVKKK